MVITSLLSAINANTSLTICFIDKDVVSETYWHNSELHIMKKAVRFRNVVWHILITVVIGIVHNRVSDISQTLLFIATEKLWHSQVFLV
jgi:hypothetical protein